MWMVLVALASGGIALFAAMRLVRSNDRNGQLLVGIGAFIVHNLVGRSVVKPYADEAKRMENPLYRAAKAHDPELYNEFKNIEATNDLQMLLAVQKRTAALIAKYAPHASDESLIRFMKLSVEQMEILSRQTKDGGFGAMFPQAGKFDMAAISSQFTEEKVKALVQALAEIIDSGANGAVKSYDEGRAERLLAQVSDHVVQRYGSHVNMLASPSTISEGARPNAASIVTATYREVLNLPPDQSALVIRHMLSRGAARLQ
jgi:hypothetical protein